MKVICFGDSNTYGYDPRSFFGDRYSAADRWVDLLAAKTGWEVINQGENGRQIPRAAVQFPHDTDLLILMLGTNDLLQGLQPSEVAHKMELFLRTLTLERERILLVAPPLMVRGEWVPNQSLIDASAALSLEYQTLAHRLGVRFANPASWKVELTYDGVHFTEEGHQIFACELSALLWNATDS